MGVETGSWTGQAEMAKAWRSTISAYDELRVRADELRELDAERLLAFHSLSGRGKMSGIQLEPAQRQILFHIRDARVTRLVIYPDRDRALADLGLKE
jgi:hypothetical protein